MVSQVAVFAGLGAERYRLLRVASSIQCEAFQQPRRLRGVQVARPPPEGGRSCKLETPQTQAAKPSLNDGAHKNWHLQGIRAARLLVYDEDVQTSARQLTDIGEC